MTNGNLISALRNMVDDIENLGAAPMTVDVSLLRQAIAALTPPEGYLLVPVQPSFEMLSAAAEARVKGGASYEVWLAMIGARPEVK